MGSYVATCRTAGCGNEAEPIAMTYDDEWGPPHAVSCGVCGQEITDLGGLTLATEAYGSEPKGASS